MTIQYNPVVWAADKTAHTLHYHNTTSILMMLITLIVSSMTVPTLCHHIPTPSNFKYYNTNYSDTNAVSL